MTAVRFRVNTPGVVQETIDGEVVIVNLQKGDYYSLVNAGADVWAGIEQGMSQSELISNLSQRYEANSETIANSVNTLLQQLQQEGIIVPNPNSEASSINQNEETPGEKLPFEEPKLGKYTDMEELLGLDPIHEVDEMGWPNAKLEEKV
ncbi:MAG: PqqD family protein [Spirulinaceae cyanobacterium]